MNRPAQSILSEAADSYPHPDLAAPAAWPGVLIIIILGLIATAAVLGPVVRAIMKEESQGKDDDA